MAATDRFPVSLAALADATRAWRVLMLLLLIVVSYLALTPKPPQAITLGWDKLNHASAFASLMFSGCFAFVRSRRALIALALALVAFGGLIEIIQSFTGRDGEWGDLLADTLGVMCGALIALPLRQWARSMRTAAR